MKEFIAAILVLICGSFAIEAQTKSEIKERRVNRMEALRELREAKAGSTATTELVPTDFNDTDSFGQNVKFLGSLYAGTLYVYRSCDPDVLEDELGGLVLAPDDHCAVHNYPQGPVMQNTDIFDNVWQVTIPKNTISNVIYPLLNNNISYDSYSGLGGQAFIRYSPRVTIVSDAFNDPAAVHPTTGLPLNGSLTVSLAGFRYREFYAVPGNIFADSDNYASVAGRGLSRAYFRTLGLPNSVINNLFKKDITLKFGISARVVGPIDLATFSYTFRLMGQ